MADYYLVRNDELALVKEVAYGTSAADPVAGDFFKSETDRSKFTPAREEFFRDADRDYAKASVTEMATGRGKTTFSIEGHLVPSGVSATPTAPDMDLCFEALLGSKHTCTAHTTTAAGSVGTTLELVAGGGAASGLQAGDLLAVDVSTAAGIEVRQVVSIATIAAVAAHLSLGSGADGVLTITADTAGAAGNSITVAIVVGGAPGTPLSAAKVGNAITITLATDAAGNPDNAANTVLLIEGVVTPLADVTASHSGTGAGWLNDAMGATNLAGGVTAPPGDSVVIDRAFTTDPAAGRSVYVGTTYRLSESTIVSFHSWLFNGSTAGLKYKVPGCIINEGEFKIEHSAGTPVGRCSFKGEGQPLATHAVAKATATTAGNVLTPDVGKVWIAATKYSIVSATLNIKNGVALRSRESDALVPNGAARTANKSRYQVEQTLDMYCTDATSPFYTDLRTARDVIVQIGATVGKIVAWRTRAFRPEVTFGEQEGEIGLSMKGRCLGVNGDDEVAIAFL